MRTFSSFNEVSGKVDELEKPLIIAHRGDTQQYTANTLDAIEHASRQSDFVDYVEVDVFQCTDGFLTYHDTQIHNQDLTGLTVAECQELGMKDGIQIPSLKDVLHICEGKVGLIIDIKKIRSFTSLLQLLGDFYFPFPQLGLTSLDSNILDAARRFAPDLPCGLILENPNPDITEVVLNKSLRFVGVSNKMLNADLVQKLKNSGAAVFTWGLTSEGELRSAIEMGVNGLASGNLKLTRFLVEQCYVLPSASADNLSDPDKL